MHSVLVSVLLGAALLIGGRRLFWLFVAATGFLYGLNFAPVLFDGGSELLYLAIALGCGVLGALLAIFAQKLAVALAGGLLGGYFVSELLYGVAWHHHFPVIAFIAGAIIGALLILMLFDWALIVCSSIAGSILVVNALHPAEMERNILFLALAAVGIAIQGGLLHRQRSLKAAVE